MKLTGFIGHLWFNDELSESAKNFEKVPTVKSYPKNPSKKLMHPR